MLNKILIIIFSVSILGIVVFSFVRQVLKRHIDQLVLDEKKNKKKKQEKK